MFGAQICVYYIMCRHEFVIIIACKDGLVDKQIPTNLSVFFYEKIFITIEYDNSHTQWRI